MNKTITLVLSVIGIILIFIPSVIEFTLITQRFIHVAFATILFILSIKNIKSISIKSNIITLHIVVNIVVLIICSVLILFIHEKVINYIFFILLVIISSFNSFIIFKSMQ